MMLIPTTIKPSPIHGLGLFAIEKIHQGQVLWEHDQVVDLKLDFDFVQNNLCDEMRRHIYMYAYIDLLDPERWTYNIDNGRFMNHAPTGTANTGGTVDSHALRDIEAGEELTCDYRVFYTPNPWQPWLETLPDLR